jgi:hypothetical protein
MTSPQRTTQDYGTMKKSDETSPEAGIKPRLFPYSKLFQVNQEKNCVVDGFSPGAPSSQKDNILL